MIIFQRVLLVVGLDLDDLVHSYRPTLLWLRGHAAVKNLQSSRMSNFAETLVAGVSSHLYQTFIAN